MLLGGEQPLNLPNTADAADAQGEESAGDAPSAKRRKDGAHGGGSSAAGAEATAMEADGAGAAAPAVGAVPAAAPDDEYGICTECDDIVGDEEDLLEERAKVPSQRARTRDASEAVGPRGHSGGLFYAGGSPYLRVRRHLLC